jgi:hypothetical protein
MLRQLLFILCVVLLIRVPFLNQAIQGDDVYYLAGAQHAQIDPAHPNHARYVYLGEMVDMRGHPHPPLNAWVLAGLLAVLGDIYEVPYHAAYLFFSVLAAVSVWSLAKRFSSRPLPATLLCLATPAFVVNGSSLESDVPFLAFWMAATALFIGAVDTESSRRLTAAAVMLALTALAAYQSVLIVPVLALYLWMKRRRWWVAWAVIMVVPATLAAWQLYERAATGETPVSVLGGYFQTYGFQALSEKLKNAAALTAHVAWVIFPVLAVAAFRSVRRGGWAVVSVAALGAAFIDPHPLFWVSFGIGTLLLVWCVRTVRIEQQDARFLTGWVLLFFAGALILFFAGSARYLLPVAAPVAILASRALAHRPRWLVAGCLFQLALSLSLSVVNYQHWDGYRKFARTLQNESESRRVWINGEWGLRYYSETDGGLPLRRGQAVRPGDVVVSSDLAFPIQFTTGGGVLTPLTHREVDSPLPFRLAGLTARSAYSTASMGLRPFDLSSGPIDHVHAAVVVERKPALSYLPMNAPEAAQQIVSGIYELESDQWRWMSERAVLLLKRPEAPAPVEILFHIPEQAPARQVLVSVDGTPVAERGYSAPGTYTLVSSPIAGSAESVTVTITIDETFSVPGDHRRLGIILSAVGFQRAQPSPGSLEIPQR